MIIRLVNDNKKTVCETDVFIKKSDGDVDYLEIISSVNIIHYSVILLTLDKKSQRRFIEDIDFLSELRGWYYEHYRTKLKKKNDGELNTAYELDECSKSIKKFYEETSTKYGLKVYTD